MGEYKRYTDEQIEQAKNADIIDFLNIHGYELKQTKQQRIIQQQRLQRLQQAHPAWG